MIAQQSVHLEVTMHDYHGHLLVSTENHLCTQIPLSQCKREAAALRIHGAALDVECARTSVDESMSNCVVKFISRPTERSSIESESPMSPRGE